MAVDLEQEIERTVGRLLDGEEPVGVLREFAKRVRSPTERVETKAVCGGCGAEEVCFRCKAAEVFGDRVTTAAPFVIPKLAAMAKEWAAEALAARRARKEAGGQQQGPGSRGAGWPGGEPPPPPPGRQTF